MNQPLVLFRRFFSMLSLVASIALPGPALAQAAQACSKHSPAHTVALLELYTSQGCDSCPPANRYVSTLRKPASGLNTDQVVPLALHVDYWDYIGWKDLFGKPLFTERQRWLAAQANTRTVYTPEVFVAGQELRGWNGGVPTAVKRINERPARADIGIVLGKTAGASVPVDINVKAAKGAQLFVALYENDLTTEVRAGENRGVTLKEDYAVRDLIGPIALTAHGNGGKAVLPRALTVPVGAVAKNLGVAAFVQSDKGEVLQAVSLPLCSG